MAEPQPAPAQTAQAAQRYQQFIQLLPLTAEIAGLPRAEGGRYYNDDQMEMRARSLITAYKHARKLARDVIQD